MTERTLSAAELAARVSVRHRRLDRPRAQRFLDRWLEQGIVEQPEPGQYRLSSSGAAMFAYWATDELNDELEMVA